MLIYRFTLCYNQMSSNDYGFWIYRLSKVNLYRLSERQVTSVKRGWEVQSEITLYN